MELLHIVKNNKVKFYKYRKGVFYYEIFTRQGDYIFPVPVEDVGDATLLARDKAILFMRYIRKALEEGTFTPLT